MPGGFSLPCISNVHSVEVSEWMFCDSICTSLSAISYDMVLGYESSMPWMIFSLVSPFRCGVGLPFTVNVLSH